MIIGGSIPPRCIYATPDQPSISSTPIVQWDAVSFTGCGIVRLRDRLGVH